MSLDEQLFKFCNPRLVFVLVPIFVECFLGIFGQLISPPRRQARMDAMLAGDLSQKLSYY